MRAWDLATTLPWAMTEDALAVLLDIAARTPIDLEQLDARLVEKLQSRLEAVAARDGRPLPGTSYVDMRGTTAVLSVGGPLFRYANLFTSLSGATSIELLARDLTAALDNPNVRAILLAIDSPGGEVNGVQEFAAMVADAAKPVIAYVSGTGASGAYWIASAADQVVAGSTALLGSIGVVMTQQDTSARDAKAGVRTMKFVSSQSPKKLMDGTDPVGQESIMSLVDSLASVFIEHVAAYRGTTPDHVARNFGQGGVFVGKAAVAAGLADRVGSFEAVLAELAAGQYPAKRDHSARAVVTPTLEDQQMADQKTTAAMPGTEGGAKPTTDPAPTAQATSTPAPATAPVLTVETVKATAPAVAEAIAKEALDAEAKRLDGIEAHAKHAPGFDDLVAKAKADRSVTPAAFAETLLAAQAAKRSAKLDALKGADQQVAVRGDVSTTTDDDEQDPKAAAKAEVAKIVAAHEAVSGHRKE